MNVAPKPESPAWLQPRRLAAMGIGAIWLSTLIWLVTCSANPVTVNRAQVALAASRGVVISGTVIDETAGRIKVVEVLTPPAKAARAITPGDEILIGDLSRSGRCRAGQRYLLPLGHRGAAFEVIPTQLPGGVPLIYPDNDEARRQIADAIGADSKAAAG